MPTENTIKYKYEVQLSLVLFALGFFYFLFLHLYELKNVPGFHFDEAWAANNAWRIFQGEVGQSQSPYTRPWAAWVASVFFQFFGVNLFIFRLSQVGMAILALLMITKIFWQEKLWRVLAFFPWVLSFLPAIPVNDRFAIEMNAFHSFCLACLLTGIHKRYSRPEKSYEAYLWILLGVLLGVSSHILFLAPCFGFLFTLIYFQKKLARKDHLLILLLCLVLLPFFLGVTMELPSKGKGIVLCILAISVALWSYTSMNGYLLVEKLGPLKKFFELLESTKYKNILYKVALLFALPFLINLIFFSDGHWTFLITHGEILFRGFTGITIGLFLLLLWKERASLEGFWKFFVFWLVISTVLAGLMMLKPAPRYFHMSMWMLAILFTFALAQLEWKKSLVACFLLFGINAFLFTTNYFLPGLAGITKEKKIHFLTYKDSSRDFLSKQRLVRYLENKSCNFQDIIVEDSRVEEAIKFLALGDWKKQEGSCYRSNLHIARRAEHSNPPSLDAELVEDFYVWSKEN